MFSLALHRAAEIWSGLESRPSAREYVVQLVQVLLLKRGTGTVLLFCSVAASRQL